jgi:tripartite-type tricarboxylate transporter receptor subunit TctC
MQLPTLALLASVCLPAIANAQSYPARAITITVTAAAGGVTDVVARAVGQRLSESWGQQVIIENKGGGAHALGAASVAKAAPDGYALLIAEAGTFVVNPTLYGKGKLPYDEERDFAPVTGLVRINQALLGRPSIPAANVSELIALARRKPGELTYGTAGVGSAPHMNMVLFESMAGMQLQPVHYRGALPALTDVIAGHIDLMSISVSLALPALGAGEVKIFGIAATSASPPLRKFRPSPRAGSQATRPTPGSDCLPPPARRATS